MSFPLHGIFNRQRSMGWFIQLFLHIFTRMCSTIATPGWGLFPVFLTLWFLGLHPAFLLIGVNPSVVRWYVEWINLILISVTITITWLSTMTPSHPWNPRRGPLCFLGFGIFEMYWAGKGSWELLHWLKLLKFCKCNYHPNSWDNWDGNLQLKK